MIKHILVFLVTLLLVSPANTDDYCNYYKLGMAVRHWDRNTGYTESNKAIGCEGVYNTEWDVSVFENSYSWTTVMVSYPYNLFEKGRFSGDIMVGMNYGYHYKHLDILGTGLDIHALPKLSYDGQSIGIDLYVLYDKGIALGFKFKLGE